MNSSLVPGPRPVPESARLPSSWLMRDNAVLTVISDLHRTTEEAFGPLASVFAEIDQMHKAISETIASVTLGHRVLFPIPTMASLQLTADLFRVSSLPIQPVLDPIPENIENEPIFEERTVRPLVDAHSSRVSFEVRLPSAPVPGETPVPEGRSQPIYYVVLNEIEHYLRQLVERRLSSLEGSQWIERRVPAEVRQRWIKDQRREKRAGRPVHPLILYSRFSDLREIITDHNNWEEGFIDIFGNFDEVNVSLRRLRPVRNAIAHNRPLCSEEEAILISEGSWILGRLGRRILPNG